MDFIVSFSGPQPPHLYLNLGQGRFEDATDVLTPLQHYSQALPGDLDGDGDTDILVMSGDGNYTVLRNQKPFLVGPKSFDFDGDGRSDISVYRPSNNIWYLNRSQAGFTAVQFGAAGDLLTPADFTGDGKTDIAVFRPSNGNWYVLRSEDGTSTRPDSARTATFLLRPITTATGRRILPCIVRARGRGSNTAFDSRIPGYAVRGCRRQTGDRRL